MNGLKKWAIDNRISRILSTFLVGVLLLLNVACSAVTAPKGSDGKLYSEQGGMNGKSAKSIQSDTSTYDYGLPENKSKVKAKTRELVDNAKKNVGNSPDIKDFSKKVNRSTENLKDDISEGAEKQKSDFVKGTKDGMKNLKGNLDKASKEIPKVVGEATDNATAGVKRSADAAKDLVDSALN